MNLFEVFVNEVGNDVASKAVDVAVNYIKKNPNLGLSVEIMAVEGNRTDSKGLLEASKNCLLIVSYLITNVELIFQYVLDILNHLKLTNHHT